MLFVERSQVQLVAVLPQAAMFRFTARGAPQAAYQFGARSFSYFGHELSRRHFARARSAALSGFIDPTKLVGALPASAFANLWCLDRCSGASLAMTTEEALTSMLADVSRLAGSRVGSLPLSDCAVCLSRTLLSNAMAVQMTLCCSFLKPVGG
jgi:hypothetical protein